MSRIAFISILSGVPWGGSEALWHQTALKMRESGHEVYANVHGWPQTPAPIQALQAAGITMEERRRGFWRRVRGKLLGVEGGADTAWLDTVKPELVVISVHCQSFGLEWMQACARRGIPYVIVVHAVVEHFWCGDAQQKPLAQGYNEAAGLFFVSHGNTRQVRLQLADDLPNARVVRNPFNVPYDASLPWPSNSGPLRLAFVGRIEPPTKGQDILCEVLAQPKWQSRDLEVTLYGDGPFAGSLQAIIDNLRLTEKVRGGGFTKNVTEIWRRHHALVLTSRAEGLPIVIVEAMLCGRPCLVTDVAGNAELLEDNLSGFVAAAPKAALVDEALERLWQTWQRGELEEMGKRAAIGIRSHVPADPIAVFAKDLEKILSAG